MIITREVVRSVVWNRQLAQTVHPGHEKPAGSGLEGNRRRSRPGMNAGPSAIRRETRQFNWHYIAKCAITRIADWASGS